MIGTPPVRQVQEDVSHEVATPLVGSGVWVTMLALIGVDAVGIGVATGSLGVLITLVGQAPQWGVYEVGLAAALFLPFAYAVAGLYQSIDMHPAEELRRMATITLLAGAAAGAGALVWAPYHAIFLALMTGLATVIVPAVRVLGRILLARTQWWGVPVVVLGAGEHGDTVIDTLRRWPELGLRPIALIHPDPSLGGDGESQAISPQEAPLFARQYDVPYAIMAIPDMSFHDRAQMIAHIGKFFRRLYVVPERAGAALWTARSSSQGLMGVAVKHVHWSRAARGAKRVVDAVGAAIGLVFAAPLIAVIAALIKLDAPGPVFFRQERMGLGGRCFEVLKFRTMHVDAEAKLQAILEADPKRRAQYERYHKLDEDPRVTRIGAWLRRFSLDELPQLWNVLKGDMSLVGPRAYMPSELPKMNGLSRPVLQCPPGLTGLWQVSGRNNLDFSTRVDLDVHYMQNWTVWLDIYIVLRTLPVVLTGEGAK